MRFMQKTERTLRYPNLELNNKSRIQIQFSDSVRSKLIANSDALVRTECILKSLYYTLIFECKSEIQIFLLLALYIFVITILKLRVCSKYLYL